jgi:hypothetical protein
MSNYATLLTGQSTARPAVRKNDSFVREVELDFATINGSSGVVQNDTVDLFTIPANTLVEKVIMEVLTVEGAAYTVSIGDKGGTAARFISAGSVNSLAYLKTGDNSENTSGYVFKAAGVVQLLAVTSGTYDAAKIRVMAFCRDISA